MAKIIEKLVSALIAGFLGAFFRSFWDMVFSDLWDISNIQWGKAAYTGFVVFVAALFVAWLIDRRFNRLAAEKTIQLAVLLQLVKELQHKHGAKFIPIKDKVMFELLVSPLAEELNISHSKARKLLKQCLASYEFLKDTDLDTL